MSEKMAEFKDEGETYIVEKEVLTGWKRDFSRGEVRYNVEKKITEDDIHEVLGYPVHPDAAGYLPFPGLFGILAVYTPVATYLDGVLSVTFVGLSAFCVVAAFGTFRWFQRKNEKLLQEVSE